MFDKQWQYDIIDLFADPTDFRTNKEKIDSVGITEQYFYEWRGKHEDEFWQAVDKARAKFKPRMRKAIYEALYKRITKSDKAVELAAKLLGDLVERTESRVEYMTPEQKRERIAKALEALRLKRLNQEKDTVSEQVDGEASDPAHG